MATGRLKIDIRRRAILEQLKSEGQVFVSDLSEKLGITPVTIRNDLDTLAMEGRLERIQGGAILKPVTAYADSRDSLPIQPEKQAIAQAVLDYIHDGDTLFINSGQTALAAAQMLSQRKKLNIVTNSLEAANCLSHQADIRLILLGGELNAIYGFTYGGDALEQLGRYQSDWSILSVDGIHPDHGITTYHADEAIVDRTMIARAKKTIIVADHNKIGRVGFSHICNIDHRHILITDNDCNPMMLDHLKNSGLSLHIAQR